MIHPRYTRDLEADFPLVKAAADHLRGLVLEHQRRGGGPLVPLEITAAEEALNRAVEAAIGKATTH
jgi:hypothetical protein